jgi:hypothetical protein
VEVVLDEALIAESEQADTGLVGNRKQARYCH